LCSADVPRLPGVAGNGGVGSVAEKPKGTRIWRKPQARERLMEMNYVNPRTLRKLIHPKPVDTDEWGIQVCKESDCVLEHQAPGVERASTSIAAQVCGTWKSRWGPGADSVLGRRTVRDVQCPSGSWKLPEANAGSRKARENHNPPDRSDGQPERAQTGSWFVARST